jgi:hypothetical protein
VRFDFHQLLKALRAASLIAWYDIVVQDEAANRAFYKVRCSLLVKPYKLDIKVIITARESIYAYQFYSTQALLRWDNEPHFPELPSFPHHFHGPDEKVLPSPLVGEPEKDSERVLQEISDYLAATSG